MPAIVLFLFGLVLRLLFAAATPDGGPCWHVGFQGDAPVWQSLAALEANGFRDVELVLPWRPPAMTWGIILLWDGEGPGLWPLRFGFVVAGALIGPLVWWLLRRRVEPSVALLAATLCAGSSNMLLVSSGLHAEAPYLALVLLSLFDLERLRERAPWHVALRWGCLHGLLCLLRGEHALVFVAFLILLLCSRARWWSVLLAICGAALPVTPWQLHANRLVHEFNAGDARLPPSELRWHDDAMARLRELPRFQQGPMFRFVDETMRVRGRDEVRAEDLDVIEEAFGCYPEPLHTGFVALQGGYAFWVANTPEAAEGYTTAPHDRPPPLAGGADRYPAYVQTDRPRNGTFSLQYPPHLDAFVHGYRKGFDEILADPAGWLARVAGKVWHSLAGATGGFGGFALPIGLSGERRPVDMVAANGVWAGIWRLTMLAVASWGVWRLRARPIVTALLVFAIARLAIVVGFYGHARHGALWLPLVLLGIAAAVHAAWCRASVADAGRATRLTAWGLMVLLLALELIRVGTVTATVDGRPWLGPAGGSADHEPHRIDFHFAGS